MRLIPYRAGHEGITINETSVRLKWQVYVEGMANLTTKTSPFLTLQLLIWGARRQFESLRLHKKPENPETGSVSGFLLSTIGNCTLYISYLQDHM